MAAKGYTTEAKVENYLLTNIDASFATQVSEWIESIENYIDKFTNRNFQTSNPSPTTKLFNGTGRSYLPVKDCLDVTLLEEETNHASATFQTITASDWYKMPTNSTILYGLKLASGIFTKGIQNYRVTARWGSSASIPKDIEFAATVMVAGIINFSNNSPGDIIQESLGGYSVSYNSAQQRDDFNRAMQILKMWKRKDLL